MADVKISALPAATTPLDGTELAPIVQSGTTKRVTVANLTTGRALSASSLTLTTPLSAGNGGTGQSSYTIGDLIYASDSTTLSKLADVATGNALISGGTGTAPSWGKVGLTTHVSGTLPVANGGTGLTSLGTGYIPFGNGTGAFSSGSGFTFGSNVLTVQTNINVSGSNFSGITFTGASVNPTGVFFGLDSGGGFVQNIRDAGYFAISTNNTERARIDSSGNLLVGTTTALARFVSRSASSSVIAGWFSPGASGDLSTEGIRVDKFDNNTTTSQVFIRFSLNNNVTASGQINANGASAAAFGTWSDARLKENIAPLPSQLSNILALKPSEFDYRDGSGHQIGFIAQEMQEVYPDVVGKGDDAMLTITGWSKTEARLVSAIQELAAKVSALEAKQ